MLLNLRPSLTNYEVLLCVHDSMDAHGIMNTDMSCKKLQTLLPTVLVLLLSYHKCLMTISEALELHVEGGRVSRSLCMCVASHGYGGLGGAGMEVVDDMHAGQSQGFCRMSIDAGELPECEVIH